MCKFPGHWWRWDSLKPPGQSHEAWERSQAKEWQSYGRIFHTSMWGKESPCVGEVNSKVEISPDFILSSAMKSIYFPPTFEYSNKLEMNFKPNTLLSRIIVPGRLFFFGIFFHPGCLIRDSPLIKITKFYPGRMPNRYSPFIFFKDF